MTNNKDLFLSEFVIFDVIVLFQFLLQFLAGDSLSWLNGLNEMFACCFNLNLAFVIAMVVSMIVQKSISVKGHHLKRIGKNTLILVFANSVIMSLYSVWCWGGIAIIAATFYGNIRKIMEIYNEVLWCD